LFLYYGIINIFDEPIAYDMYKSKDDVIKIYRDRLRDLAALGLHRYVHHTYLYLIISEETNYTAGSVRKIIEEHKRSSNWRFYERFLDTIPCVLESVRPTIAYHMINAKLSK
jgi:hypothetical protein